MKLAPKKNRRPTPGGNVSQWFTPPAFAREVVRWAGVAAGMRVVDLGAGLGALTRAALDAGAGVTAIEIDRRFEKNLKARCRDASVVMADVFDYVGARYDLALLNPPFEGEAPERFLLRALELAPRAVAIVPLNTLCGVDHFERLWHYARETRELRCVRRPSFDGLGSGQRDIVVVEIVPRPTTSTAGRDADRVDVSYLERVA